MKIGDSFAVPDGHDGDNACRASRQPNIRQRYGTFEGRHVVKEGKRMMRIWKIANAPEDST